MLTCVCLLCVFTRCLTRAYTGIEGLFGEVRAHIAGVSTLIAGVRALVSWERRGVGVGRCEFVSSPEVVVCPGIDARLLLK